jgi:hypothetical protein
MNNLSNDIKLQCIDFVENMQNDRIIIESMIQDKIDSGMSIKDAQKSVLELLYNNDI